ncbi:uncharacterized protein LOC124275718 isoform X1 [Haliotis rubra]|uniref:uncharacterized protein LOC124275718 isoform X1 n=1 Tax=Haliotis rubra TaxID=36100 RepID=UPI001EE5C30B|nr:uncharacterized protein LOC124275718 isoform X1 [Haliotis rubra]
MKQMLESVSGVFAGVMCCMVSMTYGADYCYVQAPSWTSNTSQVRLSLFISLRESQNGMCGDISRHALQTYVAVGWVIDKLNKGFIPGIMFDVKLYDDCQNPLYVVHNALDVISPSLSGIINCTKDDPSVHLGIIGPSRSVTALEAAKILNDSGIPMISPSATAADLTLNYTNFYRTALPDTVQIRPILDILKTLDWTYVALVHSDDIYGRSAATLLKTEGRKNGVCFIKSVEVPPIVDRPALFAELRQVKEATEDKHLAVVYFGLRDGAKDIMTYYAKEKMTGFYWLMSDSVGRVYDVFNGNDRVTLGTLTLSPSHVEFDELNVFWSKIKDSTPLFREYGRQANSGELFATQSDYVGATVDATYAYAVALKNAISHLCEDTSEPLCAAVVEEIKGNRFGSYLKKVDVNFTALPDLFVPPEYAAQRRHFSFKKETGDILRGPETVLYHVNAVTAGNQFVNVGNYSSRGLELNLTSIVMKDGDKIMSSPSLPRSICEGYCKQCVEFGTMPMVYVKGDVYLVGIFSIHSSDPDNPFRCEKFRSVSSDTIALEAFLYSVEEMKKTTGLKFGAVAFDDCYSSVRLTSIISEYFSSIDGPSQRFGHLVPLNQTVAVIGSLSSDSTIPLARFFNGLNIPVLSYAASSPDLDDRVNFPNFLRTVPSDVEQAKAMVQIIIEMGWEYVSLLYVSNNYGTKGMLAFQKHALAAGICVSNPKNISESSSSGVDREVLDVLDELLIEDAQIVVFFGIDTRFKDFMKAVNDKEQYGKFVVVASEDWGNKQYILESGKRATRGAITLKIQQMLEPPFPGFSESLLSKTPGNNQHNPWFKEFWQSQFSCNIRGGFNNIKEKECPGSNSLTSDNMKNHLDNQRVKHVQYATYAAGIGVSKVKATLCRDYGDVFPCRFYYDSLYRTRVWETIREVKNPQSQLQPLFDKDGNGVIGFTIYNVQADDSEQTYVEVGSYGGSGLRLEKDKIKFYDHLGYPTVISAKCSGSVCSACVRPTTAGPTLVPQSQNGPDTTFRVADIIIIVIFALFLILLLVALLIAYRYLRVKVTGLSKDIQRYAAVNNDHIYQTVSERRVYQNPAASPHRRTPTTPNHIYFVNGSHDSLNEPGGHVNQAFRADDTSSQRNASGGTSTSAGIMNSTSSSSQSRPVETPDTRQRSTSLSPSHSDQVEMTDIRNRVLPGVHGVHANGHITNGVLPKVLQQRPSTLQFHQNPRFTDTQREMIDNRQTSNVPPHSTSPVLNHPDLHHLPETFMGSPLSSLSPVSDSVIDTNSSFSQGPLSHHTSPAMASNPSILQSLANQQALLEQQAALTALEVQRLHLLQQHSAQPPSNPYIQLSAAETRPPLPPLPDQQHLSPEDQPRDRPRPRTNPQHMAPLSSRSHHGSVDSLRSSGRSRHQVSPMRNPAGENIQMQPLAHDSRISRV